MGLDQLIVSNVGIPISFNLSSSSLCIFFPVVEICKDFQLIRAQLYQGAMQIAQRQS